MYALNAVLDQSHILLAASTPGIFQGGIGTVILAVLRSVAMLLVLAAIFKAVKSVLDGKVMPAVKVVCGALFLAVILWDPTVLGGALDGLKVVVETLFNSFGTLFK